MMIVVYLNVYTFKRSLGHQQLKHIEKLVPQSDGLLHAQHRGINTNSAFIYSCNKAMHSWSFIQRAYYVN